MLLLRYSTVTLDSPTELCAGMQMTNMNNFGSLVLLFVPISNAPAAFNYIVAGTTGALAVMIAVFYKESSKRYRVDAADEDPPSHYDFVAGKHSLNDVTQCIGSPLVIADGPLV